MEGGFATARTRSRPGSDGPPPVVHQVAGEASKIAKTLVELEDEFARDAGDDVADICASGPANEAYERLVASLWADGGGAAAVLDRVGGGATGLTTAAAWFDCGLCHLAVVEFCVLFEIKKLLLYYTWIHMVFLMEFSFL